MSESPHTDPIILTKNDLWLITEDDIYPILVYSQPMFLKAPCKSFFTVNVCYKHAFPYSVFMQNPLYNPPTYNIYNIEIVCNVLHYFSSVTFPNRSRLVSPRRDTFLGRPVHFAFKQLATPLLKCLNNVSADSDTCYIREISLIFNPSVFFLWSLLSCPVTIL